MLHLFRRKCESWFYSPDILIFWDQGKSCKRFHLGFVRDTLAALFNTSWLTITHHTTQYTLQYITHYTTQYNTIHYTLHNTIQYNTLHITRHNTILDLNQYTAPGADHFGLPGHVSLVTVGAGKSYKNVFVSENSLQLQLIDIMCREHLRTRWLLDSLMLLLKIVYFFWLLSKVIFLNPEFSWYKETHQRECVVSLRGNINVQEECRL